MCRSSCCRERSDAGAGVVAVAVIAGAAFAYAKIGPVVARIWHLAVDALTIFTHTCAAAAAVIVVTWVVVRITRIGQTRRHTALYPVQPAVWHELDRHSSQPGCLACGGTGTVLRAIGSGYRDQSCPACQPVHRAG